MDSFIFNRDYFDTEFMPQCNQNKKLEFISNKTFQGLESWKKKLIGKDRRISRADYEALKKVEPHLLLDTEKLIAKLILRVNMDLTANERFVLYMMLCCLDKGQKWVSIGELIVRVKDRVYKKEKMESILGNCEALIDGNGKKKKLFISKDGKYSIDLTALIQYTDYDL